MAKQKLTFDEALQRIADERYPDASEVQSRALRRVVWVYEWHLPRCISESWGVTDCKKNAVACALEYASGDAGPPRGMRTDLVRRGRSDRTALGAWARGAITTIERRTLRDIL